MVGDGEVKVSILRPLLAEGLIKLGDWLDAYATPALLIKQVSVTGTIGNVCPDIDVCSARLLQQLIGD
jgi:hypothetical protein